jgi:hypothetical protein
MGSWVDSFERLWELRLDAIGTCLHSMGGRGEKRSAEKGDGAAAVPAGSTSS